MGSLTELVEHRTGGVRAADQAAMPGAARALLEGMRRRMAQKQDVHGRAFAPLSPRYARRTGRSRFATGTLSRALRLRKRSDLAYTISLRSTPSRTGLSLAIVGIFHQYGTRRGLPQRAFFGVSERQEAAIRAEVRKEVGRAARANPRRVVAQNNV
ncbi:MAG: phage virion morphogenesis protein [Gammaproteobacteria bacterium]